MKKYGVYVKFANNEEHRQFGGYYQVQDNVIARTPAKNADSLKPLMMEILSSIDLSQPYQDSLFELEVPRPLHRYVTHHGRLIGEIESQLNVIFTIPDGEEGSNSIRIQGNEVDVNVALNSLKVSVSLTISPKSPKKNTGGSMFPMILFLLSTAQNFLIRS